MVKQLFAQQTTMETKSSEEESSSKDLGSERKSEFGERSPGGDGRQFDIGGSLPCAESLAQELAEDIRGRQPPIQAGKDFEERKPTARAAAAALPQESVELLAELSRRGV